MGILVSCNNLMPQRRDCQCTPVILVGGGGTIIAGGVGNSGGGVYEGSSSICVNGTTISAIFGTGSTTVACGSHTHNYITGTTGRIPAYATSSTLCDSPICTNSGCIAVGMALTAGYQIAAANIYASSSVNTNVTYANTFYTRCTAASAALTFSVRPSVAQAIKFNSICGATPATSLILCSGGTAVFSCLVCAPSICSSGVVYGSCFCGCVSAGATCLDALTDVVIATPASGQLLQYNGSTWCNTAPTALSLTSGCPVCYNGTTLVSYAGVGGNVCKVGTPVDNQIGTWTGDGTIEGYSGLTYNRSTLVVGGNICMGQLLLISAASGNPEFDFREGTTTRAKTYYDVTNNRLTFQNNEVNTQDALYFADHVTTTGNITIGGCLITPIIKITTGAAAGCVLTSAADGTAAWCTPSSGGASCLDALNDVVIASPACNQILQYSGSIWCNCTPTNIGANMSAGQVLCYNGTTITGVTSVSCAASATNALALCGCVPTCFLGTTATANNSNCLGGVCSTCYVQKTSTISPKTANYTLQASDNGTIIIMSGASALCLTVPTAFGTCGYNVTVIRRGAGAVCILAGASTTKLSDGSKSCIGVQYGAATIVMLESCRFILAGNLV